MWHLKKNGKYGAFNARANAWLFGLSILRILHYTQVRLVYDFFFLVLDMTELGYQGYYKTKIS